MAKQIEPRLSTVGNYLRLNKGVIFSIPNYQRPYSWKIEQCDKLWQDILDKDNEEGTDNYFFGTIIISCSDNDTIMNLIDGQQRTTTFILLLKALLMKINEALLNFSSNDIESSQLLLGLKDKRRRIIEILYGKDPEYVSDMPNEELDKAIYKDFNLIVNNANNEDYSADINNILKASSFDEAESEAIKKYKKQKDNKYSNYFRNFKFFYEEKFKELKESNLNKITKTILDKCEIIVIKSWDLDQAIKMFNSLNSDGLPLCDSDIISSLLYSAAKNAGNLDTYENNWKILREIIKPLEDKKVLSIDTLLMQEMYYERAKNGETINASGKVDVTTPGLRKYFKTNGKFINDPINSSEKLINLAKIWEKVIEYPIIKVLSKFNENSKLFLASYFYRFKSDDIIEQKYIKNDELNKDMISNLSEIEIKELERKLLIKKENDRLFECMLRLFTILELVDIGYSSNKFKTFLFDVETKLIDESISIDEIESIFDNHIKENWKPYEITESIDSYEKHNLVVLNEYIYAKNRNIEFDIDDQYNIEHIMPASGKEIEGISKGALMENMDEFNLFVNKIGNKILLESKINQSVSNTWFRMKITSTVKNNGYQKSKYPLAQHLVEKYAEANDKACWTKYDISNATKIASENITNFIFKK